MNVKHSPCMNRKAVIFLIVLFFGAFAADAQSYYRIFRRNFWNDGDNVVGIRQDTVSRSVVDIYGKYVAGEYKASFEAESQWNAGIHAATVRHLEKFSMAGEFGFEQAWGEGMKGSMFIKPGFYPFNIYEFTPGPKTLQVYTVRGGISVDVAPHWRIGGKVDLETSNYSKRKDLRHTNYRMEMTFAPGVQYHNGKLALGAAYVYSRNTETLTAEQVGSSVSGYEAFFDKGLYYGVRELWTGSSMHLSEAGVNGFPVCENIHGVSAQMSYGNVYADVRWRSRYGIAGEKQCIWYRFPGWDLRSRAGWRFASAHGSNTFRLAFDMLDQSNYETVLDKTTTGGVTTYVEYGSNLIFRRVITDVVLDYKFAGQRWEFGGTLALADQKGEVSMMYPYAARQHLVMPAVQGSALVHCGRVDLSLMLRWGQGAIKDKVVSLDDASGVQGELERLDSYYIRFKEHMTSYKLAVAPAVRYNFPIGIYVEASGRWIQGFEIQYLSGNYRASAMFSVGYNF